ncbi:hypothetical protein [Halomicrobium salinisoli]|uniref:hypothetical protein n=1 Tax=Halomicrobium salinisoli TaxID=2878391 RepID=UPI001CF05367|nr:hypothetical protein [Halomicrobium salinisoli]
MTFGPGSRIVTPSAVVRRRDLAFAPQYGRADHDKTAVVIETAREGEIRASSARQRPERRFVDVDHRFGDGNVVRALITD